MPKESKPKATQKERHAQRVLGRDKSKQRAAKGNEEGSGGEVAEGSKTKKQREKEEKEWIRERERSLKKEIKAATPKPARAKSSKSTPPSPELVEAQKTFKVSFI
jgi:hypothetical protein